MHETQAAPTEHSRIFIQPKAHHINSVVLATVLTANSAVMFSQTPYSGMYARPNKPPSDQQVANLKTGRGMGLALAAELNGCPGPSHILKLANKLDLSPAVNLLRAAISTVFFSAEHEGVELG